MNFEAIRVAAMLRLMEREQLAAMTLEEKTWVEFRWQWIVRRWERGSWEWRLVSIRNLAYEFDHGVICDCPDNQDAHTMPECPNRKPLERRQ